MTSCQRTIQNIPLQYIYGIQGQNKLHKTKEYVMAFSLKIHKVEPVIIQLINYQLST